MKDEFNLLRIDPSGSTESNGKTKITVRTPSRKKTLTEIPENHKYKGGSWSILDVASNIKGLVGQHDFIRFLRNLKYESQRFLLFKSIRFHNSNSICISVN